MIASANYRRLLDYGVLRCLEVGEQEGAPAANAAIAGSRSRRTKCTGGSGGIDQPPWWIACKKLYSIN